MSVEPVPGRMPALITATTGALLAFVLALDGFDRGADWSVSHPADLLKFLFLAAPASPFLVLGGVALAVRDRFLLTGLTVIGCLLIFSCAVYLQAQAEQRARPEALFALVYLFVPFLQAASGALAFAALLGWRAWRRRRA